MATAEMLTAVSTAPSVKKRSACDECSMYPSLVGCRRSSTTDTPRARVEKAEMYRRTAGVLEMRPREHHLRLFGTEADGSSKEETKNRRYRPSRGKPEHFGYKHHSCAL